MFKNVIATTPFTTSTANDYFNNIYGDDYRGDYTFLATLRALLAPRMKEGDSLYETIRDVSYPAQRITDYGKRSAVIDISNFDTESTGMLLVTNFQSMSPENNKACMELMKTSFCDVYKGWSPLEKVTLLFRKVFNVLCFVNPEQKSTIIFTENMSIREMHYLQAAILGCVPWYFNPEEGIREIEKELIESLREKTSTKYEDCLVRMAKQYDFRALNIKKMLDGFETRYEKMELDKARRDVENVLFYMGDLDRKMAEYLKQKRDYEIKILGLETKIAQGGGESEIMDYFMCNEKIVLEGVTDTTMTFGVKEYLTYYDEEMLKHALDNKSSYIYRPSGRDCSHIISPEDMRALMTAVFIDETIKLRICALYRFTLEGTVNGIQRGIYSAEYNGYTPNPHIDGFACLGNYKTPINQCLKEHNYISAIEQSIASCKSLNFTDSTVMNEFMRRLYGISDRQVNIKCFELPDGRVVTPEEAIQYLKQEDNTNGEDN